MYGGTLVVGGTLTCDLTIRRFSNANIKILTIKKIK
jgi:hypothetical protein